MNRNRSVPASDYLMPVAVSVLLHSVIVLLVVWGWESAAETQHKVVPRYIEAKLIALTPETVKTPKAFKPKPKVIDVAAKKREQEKAAAAAQKKRLASEKVERERLRKLAQEKELQQKQEREKQTKAEQARKAKELREKELLEQQRVEQRRQEDAFADALADEEEMIQAQLSEATAQSYVAAMAERIENNWSRPPSARTGMKCELQLQLVPSGDVVNVTVTKSSGNSAFDRSAEQAVNKVGQFEVLKTMPPEMFERYFRQVTLAFNPRDLRL